MSSLPDGGKMDVSIALDASDLKQIKNAGTKRGVRLKLVSTFTDGDGAQQIITSKVRLDR